MCTNLVDKNQHTFTWKIKNFSSCAQKKGVYLESPVFTAESLDGTTWCLRLYPRGAAQARSEYISCYLHRSKEDGGPVSLECEFRNEIIGAQDKPIYLLKGTNKFEKGSSWGMKNFFEKKLLLNKNACLFGNTLTMRCHLVRSVPKKSLFSENVGLTEIGIDQCSFKKTVKNLNSSCFEVAKFHFSGTSQIEVTVQAPDDDIEIDVRRAGSLSESQYVICKIVLLDVKGEEQDSILAENLFEAKGPSTLNKSDVWKLPTFIKKSQLNSLERKYLKNNAFTLLCEICVSNGTILGVLHEKQCNSSFTKISTLGVGDTVGVLKDLNRMFKNKIQTDVKLHVANQDFFTHKCILSSRSPVFLAMFAKDMTESQIGTVDIPDLDAKTVESLLEFMYTGTVEHLDGDTGIKLMVAADKYQIPSLKEKCAEFLMSVMSDANVCEILVFADLVQNKRLETSAVSYIKEHPEKVLASEDWKHCVKSNLKLATETVCKVSAHLAAERKRIFTSGTTNFADTTAAFTHN